MSARWPEWAVECSSLSSASVRNLACARDAWPDAATHQHERERQIAAALAYVLPADRWVLRCRYGLDEHEPMTTEEIAYDTGLTQRQVRICLQRGREALKLTRQCRNLLLACQC